MTNTELRSAHLRDYWRVIWRGRYTVLAVFVLVVALAVLKIAVSTPVYQATAVLEIKPEARSILPGQEQWVGSEGRSWIADELYFNTQLQVLQSRELAERAFRQLPPDERAAFEGSDPVGQFAGSVSVRPRVNTRLVELRVVSTDPQHAADWANLIARTYVQRNVDEAMRSFEDIMATFRGSLSTFREDLGAADERSLSSAKDTDLYVPEDQRAILAENLRKYNAELASIRLELGSLTAELDQYEEILRGDGDIMALPRFAEDETLQDLNAMKLTIERDIERLTSERKLDQHPELIAKRNDLETVEGRMRDQVELVADEMRQRRRILSARAGTLSQEIARTEERAFEFERRASKYELVKTDAESKRRVYDVVAERMEQLAMGASLIAMNNNVGVLDEALVPSAPIRPRRTLTLAFGAFVGMFLGVGAVLFLDYLDNTIRTPDDIENALGLNVLAIVPRYRGASDNAVREAYQSLRTSILFASRDSDRRVLLFTSAGPQEGKSSTVKHVARSMAASGDSVVVLDCDLRRPTQHKHLEVPREPGLTNYLLARDRDADYRPFTRPTSTPNLTVMTCGPIPPNPTDLVGSARFKALVETLRKDYDWVIIDSPPVASIADTIVLSSIVDLLVLVIKHNQNDRDEIRRSLKRLGDTDAKIAGAVLNGMQMGGSYGSYYTAYDYYDADKVRAESDGGEAAKTPEPEDRKRIAL